MPITPIGVLTLAMVSPFGRVHRSSSDPIGSGSSATASNPAAMASTRSASSNSRSNIAGDSPFLTPKFHVFLVGADDFLLVRAHLACHLKNGRSAYLTHRQAANYLLLGAQIGRSHLYSSPNPPHFRIESCCQNHIVAVDKSRTAIIAERFFDVARIQPLYQRRFARGVAD